MSGAYYNEFDPYAAQWLRNLIAAGLIADGEVDERSIVDVRPADLAGFAQCHFFAGIGGWSYALRLAGWPDERPVWTGSCPCQPFSAAGKQRGEDDERHLWPVFAAIIRECKPAIVFGEQVASKLGREWLAGVRADLEDMAYAVGAADLCAAGKGAPHIRQRLFWLADAHGWQRGRLADGEGRQPHGEAAGRQQGDGVTQPDRIADGLAHADGGLPGHGELQPGGQHGQQPEDGRSGGLGDADDAGPQGWLDGPGEGGRSDQRLARPAGLSCWSAYDIVHCTDGKARRFEPGSFPLAHGVPARVGRLRGYGNAISPPPAAAFVEAYLDVRFA
jgi:DNA (cytosine-5)-methyltransferase 1